MCTKFHQNRSSSFRENQYFIEFSVVLCAIRRAPCAVRHAPCAMRRAPYAARRTPCLISPVLIIALSSNFIFKTFLGPGLRIFHIRCDSPDRKFTLQRRGKFQKIIQNVPLFLLCLGLESLKVWISGTITGSFGTHVPFR